MLKNKKTLLLSISLAVFLGFSTTSFADSVPQISYNKDGKPEFKILKPARSTQNPAKIEVVEMFSYGCPHCFDLESSLLDWKKNQAKNNVEFKRIPAVFRPEWEPLAKIYYTLEALNLVEKYHGDVFNAIQVENLNLTDESVLADWIKKKGIPVQKFMDTYKSFGVKSKLEYSKRQTKSYEITGVPSLIVNGKYVTSGGMATNFNRMFEIVDNLVKKEQSSIKH